MKVNILSAGNPRFGDEEKTVIVLDVIFEHLGDEAVPFGAMANDPEAHGRVLYGRAVSGEFGPIAEYTAELPPNDIVQTQPISQGSQTL